MVYRDYQIKALVGGFRPSSIWADQAECEHRTLSELPSMLDISSRTTLEGFCGSR